MGVPKRKMSKMKKRSRKGANRYAGVQVNLCTACKAPVMPHCACKACGVYDGKKVISAE